jgi:hypothetical protein
MKKIISSICLTLAILIPLSVSAQDDQPLVADINYDMTVQESITDHAFFDWWRLEVALGDTLMITMNAADGLQPLLGLLDENSELMTRSDLEQVAEVDGMAFIQYTAVTAGQYTIIASRDGRDQGTTTGAYLLTVNNRNNEQSSRPNPFLETEFRCSEWLLTNALTFQFSEDYIRPETIAPGEVTEYYRVSVYGLDGFEPVMRILANVLLDRPLDCTDSSQASEGNQLDLPFLDEPYIVTDKNTDNVTIVTITNSGDGDPLGNITISIGAKEGTSGRFIVVLEGLELHERDDDDEILLRRGAFAGDSPLDIYMIGESDNRLDSFLEIQDEEAEADSSLMCDDIGRDDCADFPELAQSTIMISEDEKLYTADKFDSQLRFDSPDNTPIKVKFHSREYNTDGKYVVVFVGELPARD